MHRFRRGAEYGPQGHSPVVDSPSGIRRRPHARHKALVRVNGWADQRCQLRHELELPGHVMFHQLRHYCRVIAIIKEILLVLTVPEALVRVAAATRETGIPL